MTSIIHTLASITSDVIFGFQYFTQEMIFSVNCNTSRVSNLTKQPWKRGTQLIKQNWKVKLAGKVVWSNISREYYADRGSDFKQKTLNVVFIDTHYSVHSEEDDIGKVWNFNRAPSAKRLPPSNGILDWKLCTKLFNTFTIRLPYYLSIVTFFFIMWHISYIVHIVLHRAQYNKWGP